MSAEQIEPELNPSVINVMGLILSMIEDETQKLAPGQAWKGAIGLSPQPRDQYELIIRRHPDPSAIVKPSLTVIQGGVERSTEEVLA